MTDPPTPPTIPYATPDDLPREQWIVRPGRGRGIVLIFVGGFLLLLCALLLALGHGGPRIDCQIALLIGGITVATGVYHLANRKPCLILTDASLVSTLGSRIELRWTDLARAQTVTQNDAITYLILRPAGTPINPQPPTPWNHPTFDRPQGAEHDDIVLRIDGLSASPHRILREIQLRIAATHTTKDP